MPGVIPTGHPPPAGAAGTRRAGAGSRHRPRARQPRGTERGEAQGGVGDHFILTKATSHVLFKVHYNSPSTNHRHKPGIVQIRPTWRRTPSGQRGRGKPGERRQREQGWGRGRGAGVQALLQTDPKPTSRDGQRAGREQTRARRGSAPRADPGRSLRLGMRWGPCPALRGSPGVPRGAGQSSSSQHPTPGQLAAHVAPRGQPQPSDPVPCSGKRHPSIHPPLHPSIHPPRPGQTAPQRCCRRTVAVWDTRGPPPT